MRDRLIRLGVPLLVFLVLLRPLVTLPDYAGGEPFWRVYLRTWDPGPLWFAEVLLVLALAYALCRRWGSGAGAGPSVPKGPWIVLFTVGLAAVTILWRIPVPVGAYVPVLGLPTPYFLPQYVSMFVVGLVAFRRGWFETLPRRAGRIGFAVAFAATAVCLPVMGLTTGAVTEAVTATWEIVFAVGLILGLVVLFRERFAGQGPRGRFLSEHAYTVYVVHPLVLVAVGYALSGIRAAAIVKFALAAALCLPLCWGLAYLVRSLPGARRVL